MNYILFLIATIVFLRGLITLCFLFQSLNWLETENANGLIKSLPKKVKLHIFIPVLREQKRIIETIKYFLKNVLIHSEISLTIIATQREFEKQFNGPSTFQLVKDFISNNNISNVSIMDTPFRSGIKAEQLNYALKNINDGFITVYDADSRPHVDTVYSFYKQLKTYQDAKIFQQSSLFFNNFKRLGNSFLKSSAILQTRWTLTHEIPRLLRQSISNNKIFKKYAYAHVVGHGLIIDTNILKSIGGFPDKTITEDLFLGYLLRTNGYSIYPLPLLELSDAPMSLKGLWNQKYVWFFGPLKMVTYLLSNLQNKNKFKTIDVLAAILMTAQGIVSTLAWLLSGPFILFLLLSPLLTTNTYLILFCFMGILLYGPIQYFVTLSNSSKLLSYSGIKTLSLSHREIVNETIMSLPAIIFNSIPPYFAFIDNIKCILFGSSIYKPKTDD